MHTKSLFLFAVSAFTLIFSPFLYADTENVSDINARSECMNKDIAARVFLPDGYNSQPDKRWPVVYLLHGHGGNFKSWNGIRPDLQKVATRYETIIVCPDGQNTWYWDSIKDKNVKYETYITKELVPLIDSKYRTIADRSGRAITGLSMGGHGGLWFGFRHPDIFGACGSQSGGVDIRPFPRNWHMADALGQQSDNPQAWEDHTVINMVNRIKPNELYITIECGTEDFFYEVNEALHKKLLYMNIPHDYATRPGKHNSDYWKDSIDYQLLGFSKYFSRAAAEKSHLKPQKKN